MDIQASGPAVSAPVSRPVMCSTGGRIVYRPADVIPWITGKTVAMICDGPSKRKYIYAPDKVISFAINKAALSYPCSMAVAVGPHFDEIGVQLRPWIPILFLGEVDIRRHNIGPSLWTVIVLLAFLGQHASKIYIQGLDMSAAKYREQIPIFQAAVTKGLMPKDKIICVADSPISGSFTVGEPAVSDIC